MQVSTFELVITSIFAFILLTYLLFEIIFYHHLRMTFIQRSLVSIGLKKRIRNAIPPWWEISKIEGLNGINRPIYKSRVWVEIKAKFDLHHQILLSNNCCGWVELDRWGRVENMFNYQYKDNLIPKEVKKKYKREKLLSDLNIY